MQENIMVSVIIVAYNHEKYIREAIEGVLNQTTTFRYELIVHDDASTDHTPEIIREYEKKYPDIIKTIFEEENQFQYGKLGDLFFDSRIQGKYLALCDGDDYWTDKEKLQKQVHFLETHDEYSMCIHNAEKLDCMTGERKILDTFPEDGTYSQKEQILAGLGTDYPASASYVLRAGLIKNMPRFFIESRVLDYPVRQFYASCGKIYYFKKPMSVYRVSTLKSYMSATKDDQTFYNDYTVEMINFFEKFNQYTEKKFDNILQEKIISDYLGFCTSITEREGLEKALCKGLDIDFVREVYRRISREYLDSSIQKICEKADNLFIYGTSRLARICKRQLEYAGIEFEGFAVSDGQMKVDNMDNKKVYYLGDILKKYKNPGFILAVQPVNANIITNTLKKLEIDNFCKPFMFMKIV